MIVMPMNELYELDYRSGEGGGTAAGKPVVRIPSGKMRATRKRIRQMYAGHRFLNEPFTGCSESDQHFLYLAHGCIIHLPVFQQEHNTGICLISDDVNRLENLASSLDLLFSSESVAKRDDPAVARC